MTEMSLDQWKSVPTQDTKKPLVIDDNHARSLYEDSYERYMEKLMDWQIAQKLAEEKEEENSHKNYVSNNYIRIGGN
jgi:hypothetical protein